MQSHLVGNFMLFSRFYKIANILFYNFIIIQLLLLNNMNKVISSSFLVTTLLMVLSGKIVGPSNASELFWVFYAVFFLVTLILCNVFTQNKVQVLIFMLTAQVTLFAGSVVVQGLYTFALPLMVVNMLGVVLGFLYSKYSHNFFRVAVIFGSLIMCSWYVSGGGAIVVGNFLSTLTTVSK